MIEKFRIKLKILRETNKIVDFSLNTLNVLLKFLKIKKK